MTSAAKPTHWELFAGPKARPRRTPRNSRRTRIGFLPRKTVTFVIESLLRDHRGRAPPRYVGRVLWTRLFRELPDQFVNVERQAGIGDLADADFEQLAEADRRPHAGGFEDAVGPHVEISAVGAGCGQIHFANRVAALFDVV